MGIIICALFALPFILLIIAVFAVLEVLQDAVDWLLDCFDVEPDIDDDDI